MSSRAWRAKAAIAIFGVVVASAAACVPRAQERSMPSTSKGEAAVIYAARLVRTLDPERPLAEAVAVEGGKVLAVGTREELVRAHPGAQVAELPGGVIVPGLQDAHGHLRGLGNSLAIVDLFGAASEAEAVARVKAAPPESRRGDWIEGRGWDQNRWPGQQFPTRALLDEAFPDTRCT